MNSFFQENMQFFIEQMEKNSVAVFFSGNALRRNGEMFYPFSLDRNFYYLLGLDQENLSCIIYKSSENAEISIYHSLPEVGDERWFGMPQPLAISGIKNNCDLVRDLESYFNHPFYAEKLYLPSHLRTNNETLDQYYKIGKIVKNTYPFVQIINSIHILTEMRLVKKEYEIEKIKQSIEVTNTALAFVASNMKNCTYEYEVRANLHYQIAAHNRTTSFQSVCAAGQNSTVVCSMSKTAKLHQNDLILIDVGVETDYYTSDITRALPVSGRFTNNQKIIYEILLDTQAYILQELKPNCCENHLDDKLTAFLAKALRSIKLIDFDEEISKYKYHGLGHSLGLLCHDLENRAQIIKEDSLWTIEPALFIPEWGFGIRIEDDIWVRKAGNINISQNIPRSIADIENLFL